MINVEINRFYVEIGTIHIKRFYSRVNLKYAKAAAGFPVAAFAFYKKICVGLIIPQAFSFCLQQQP